MGHNSRCANAKTDARKCRCSCGGNDHATNLAGSARARSGSGHAAFQFNTPGQSRSDADEGNARKKRGRRERGAIASTAVAEIVDWLILNPTTTDHVQAMANAIGNGAAKELDKSLRGARRSGFKKAISKHIWCAFLAASAHAIVNFKHQLEQMSERVISMIIDSIIRDECSTVDRVAAKIAWKAVEKLAFFRQVDELLRVTRILAVLTCPAPEKHPAVLRYCLTPLGAEVVSAIAAQQIEELLQNE